MSRDASVWKAFTSIMALATIGAVVLTFRWRLTTGELEPKAAAFDQYCKGVRSKLWGEDVALKSEGPWDRATVLLEFAGPYVQHSPLDIARCGGTPPDPAALADCVSRKDFGCVRAMVNATLASLPVEDEP